MHSKRYLTGRPMNQQMDKSDRVSVQIPLLQSIGNKDMGNKISFDILVKFIEDNKQLLLNPQNDIIAEPENKVSSEPISTDIDFIGIGDSKEISFLPDNLHNIFADFKKDMFRFGVLREIRDKVTLNISLLSSILVCLKNDFITK